MGIFHSACAETGVFLLPVKNLMSPSFSATPISYKGDIFAIWGRLGAVLGIFSLRMRRNGGISTSGQKSDVAIVFIVTDLPLRCEICAIWGRLGAVWGTFPCACAETGLFLLPVKHLTSPSFSATPISYKRVKFVRFGDV